MKMVEDDNILVSHEDRVMTITLNRPHKLNAYAAEMRPNLVEAVRQGDESKDVGCIVIKGAGRAFCTGSDFSADVKPGHKDYENAYDASISDDIRSLQKGEGSGSAVFFGSQTPIIAQVHGWCLAGGLEIAMKCDFIVCSDDAKFGYPIVRNMASPPSHMFTYLMGTQWTRYLLYTGDHIDGPTAAQVGLGLKSVPLDELDDTVKALAIRIATVPPQLLAVHKSVCEKALDAMGRPLMQDVAIEANAMAHKTTTMRDFYAIGKERGYKEALDFINQPYTNERS
jgi:enoyl-CoA hydratase